MTDAMFEARLERAARRIADEAVRPIDAVEIANAAMRASALDAQRSSAVSRGRQMRAALAVIATLVLAVAGLSLIVLRQASDAGPPPPSSSPSPGPASATPAPSVGAGTTGNGGIWLADRPANLSFGSSSEPTRMTLAMTTPDLTIAINSGSDSTGWLLSSYDTDGGGNIQLRTLDAAPGSQQVTVDGTQLAACVAGDEGLYASTQSVDGMLLTLTPVSEDCASRQAVFARTWSRSLGVPGGGGGLGVIDAFEPPFTVNLPTGNYQVDRSIDAMTIHQDFPEFQFLAFKDPQGFLDPCDRSKGRFEIAPGADAFVDYFQQLDGFTVDSTEELQVDGIRAVKLVVQANDDASCPDGMLWEWQPKAETSEYGWFLRPGVTDSLYIVEHPAGTLMFEVLPAPNPIEQDVISTIQFLDALPTRP